MSCAVLSKEPFLPGVAFTWLGMIWLRGDGSEPTRESVKLFVGYSLAGVALLALGLCVYMVPTGSMKAYITMVRGYSRIYRDPQGGYCVALGIAHPSTPLQELAEAWQKIRTHFFNIDRLGVVLPLFVPGSVYVFRRSRPLFAAMVLVALGALWAPTATNCMWVHYYNMSLTGVIFGAIACADSLKGKLATLTPGWRSAIYVTAATIVWMRVFPTVRVELYTAYQRGPWQEPQPGILEFIAKNTTPADRIFTSGPPILYVQADRISAVRETNIIDEILGSYDGATDEEKFGPLREQLLRNRPKVVFMDPENGHRKKRHNQTLILPFLAEQGYQKINDQLYLRR
jgi:hypothetical protein